MQCTSFDCEKEATEHFDVYADGKFYAASHKCSEHAVTSKANVIDLGWLIEVN